MTLNLLFLFEVPCKKDSRGVSVFNLKGNLYEFIARVRDERPELSVVSVITYYGERLGRVLRMLRVMSNTVNVNAYLLTPLGVLTENDLIVPYRECFDDLSKENISNLLSLCGMRDRIYDLLEAEYDLALICVNHKILSILELDYYVPINKPIIVVSEGYGSTKENIYVVTKKHSISNYLKRRNITLCELIVDYLIQVFSMDNLRKNILERVISRPKDFFDELFNPKLIRIIFNKRKSKQVDIRKFLWQRG